MPTDKKISELAAASAINASDVSILINTDTDYQYTFTQLLQFLEANLAVGAHISFGTVLPQNTAGSNGDVFVNTAAASFAQKVSGTWAVVYTLPAGGAADGTLLYGTGLPASATGKNTDSYINTLTGIFYQKASGAWSQVFSMATGPQGPQGTAGTNGTNGTDGNTILFGAIDPSNTTTGINGNFYINTLTYNLFGPKIAGAWGSGVSLFGAGLVQGGTAGQVLTKVDGTDYNTQWEDNSFAALSGEPGDNTNMAAALAAKQDTLGYTPENVANKNQPGGYAGLDGSGKVASAQLPAFVDAIVEVANFAALPTTGETGKIYITIDTNLEYRWSGSAYIQIVASPGTTDALAEGSTNKYFTAARVIASVLTGIGFSSVTAVTATDTILAALGKLQAQITGLFKIPTGGTSGQVLAKASATDGDTHWVDVTGGGTTEPSGRIKSFKVDYAAVGDGITDDTIAINNAIASETAIYDNGDFLVTTNPINPLGISIKGNIRILKQDTYLKQQINTYADDYQHVFGLEYLSSFHKKLIAATPVKIILEGDSTTSGAQITDANFHLDGVLNKLLAAYSVPSVVTVVNSGAGGTDLEIYESGGALAADLALNPDLMVIRWGVNQSWLGSTVAIQLAAFDSYLSTIRSNASFTRDKLAIVLCSASTTTTDTNGHQGQIWNEAWNKGLRILARKYFCTYIDVYALWQDSVNGQDYINAVDNVAYPNDLIHPQGVYNTWVGSKIFDIIFPKYFVKPKGIPPGGSTTQVLTKINGADFNADWESIPFIDRGSSSRGTGDSLSTYAEGVTIEFVNSDFPIPGILMTNKTTANGGMGFQVLSNYSGTPTVFVRANFSGWQSWLQLDAGSVIASVLTGYTSGAGTLSSSDTILSAIQKLNGNVAALTNPLHDHGGTVVAGTAIPSTYPAGITFDFANADGTFPIAGFLVTHRGSTSGFTRQELTSYATATVMYVRVAYNDTWQAFKQVTLT